MEPETLDTCIALELNIAESLADDLLGLGAFVEIMLEFEDIEQVTDPRDVWWALHGLRCYRTISQEGLRDPDRWALDLERIENVLMQRFEELEPGAQEL